MTPTSRRPPAPFHLLIRADIGASAVPYLRRHIRKAHQLLAAPLREFSIALVNDRRMSELHVQFMNIPGPTDVLTFPLELCDDGKAIAGEVVVCVPEARRRAKEHGVAVRDELLLYALHGMLHLSGFDDRTAHGFARMHRTEDDILQRLGVGPVFHSRAIQISARKRGGR
jgi:probable rRNA maturation factor